MTAEALLLTCIDFRFLDFYPRLMEQLGLTGRYDQISLPSASLVLSGIPNENQKITLLEQIKAAKGFDQARRVILVNHEKGTARVICTGSVSGVSVLEKEGKSFPKALTDEPMHFGVILDVKHYLVMEKGVWRFIGHDPEEEE